METLGLSCESGKHEQCPHVNGFGVRYLPRRDLVILCMCPCHEPCPFGGQEEALEQRWLDACTCPGSAAVRQKMLGRSGRL